MVFAPLETLRRLVLGGDPPKGRLAPMHLCISRASAFPETLCLSHIYNPDTKHSAWVLGQVVG